MSQQRQRFIDEMKLEGFAESTIKVYVASVRRLSEFYGKAPLSLSNEEIRKFLLHLRKEKVVAAQSYNGVLAAIKFFFGSVDPERDISSFKLLPTPFKIPPVFTQEEVGKLLDAVTNLKHKTILSLMYSTGIRIGECVKLKIKDIDRERKLLKVHGKWSRDRNVRLSESALSLLRKYYRSYRPKDWLFEGRDKTTHIHAHSVLYEFRKALKKAGIKKKARPHTLRHSYATHLLEQQCPLPVIQRFLGHKRLSTTTIYLHTTPTILSKIKNPLDCLMGEKKKGGKSHG